MDVAILRKRSRLQTQERDKGRKGWCPLLSFVLVVRSLWSKATSPLCCHLTCLYSVYLFLPLSVLPLAFCCFFCQPPITLSPFSERKKKKVGGGEGCTPGRSTATETLLWFPWLLSMGLSPQPKITPMSHCLNVLEAFLFFFFYSSWGRFHTSCIY